MHQASETQKAIQAFSPEVSTKFQAQHDFNKFPGQSLIFYLLPSAAFLSSESPDSSAEVNPHTSHGHHIMKCRMG